MVRIGLGIDYHRLVKGRLFILGGVHIPCEYGCEGHSDADVLLHAICDAMLGALALGDIGKHFPNTDPQYKDINSLILLTKVYEMITLKRYTIGNIDTMIMLQQPHISAFIPEMKKIIAQTLFTSQDNISIKATTTEKMGFVGRCEGIEAHAIVLLNKM